MTPIIKAWALRAKLFELVNEFKDLQAELGNLDLADFVSEDARFEATTQADQVSCALAGIHSELPDLFIDAARDESSYLKPLVKA